MIDQQHVLDGAGHALAVLWAKNENTEDQ